MSENKRLQSIKISDVICSPAALSIDTVYTDLKGVADANSKKDTAAIELCQYSSILSIISLNRAQRQRCSSHTYISIEWL